MSAPPMTPMTTDYAAIVDAKQKAASPAPAAYKPVFLGMSARDLVLIPCLLVFFYAVVACYFSLLLHAVVQTQNSNAALWMFFGIFLLALIMATFFLNVSAVKKSLPEKADA
ncbi:hypothetical protein SPRG_07818 [Saprolegnia parasitica CBS 223.65]|uniref:Uncharacterized protein n=1 Tax=Saprolegnia parasitica (strain CBS 223.65) TaxID=695850 RepID=A0A067CJY1_SAPPC|nr:hypothetical protein SPRG_07818 [Saprolegnia parasitica CBS 223.65]KDO27107.1 hypothetical protein SPRG_07818 [Saprolegnia parasitica CBS 223.65]|eukprot:XP_012202200.1 hypothetical protein SPRG_07818 [Saprolegnia parasitica CBS 223.65]